MMNDRGHIYALDHDQNKLFKIEEEMRRLGASIVRTGRHDLHHPIDENRLEKFDRILLDAPCSGLGVIRRNPDIKWSTLKGSLKSMQARQLGFLQRLAPLVKPGGILLYAVCSTEAEENDAVIESFLKKFDNFAIDRDYSPLFQKWDLLVDPKGYLRTFPHRHGTDGFFSARLKRLI
jgi:16S rRNA (cytosine967-C5)-methyltransferase